MCYPKFTINHIGRNLYNVSRDSNISILPIPSSFEMNNYYPLGDHPELWSTFVVSSDKKYIIANINDPNIKSYTDASCNDKQAGTNGRDILPSDLQIILDDVWSNTFTGRFMQFYMVWNGTLFFVMSYPFYNRSRKLMGGILLMRAFETLPAKTFTSLDGYMIPTRHSNEIIRRSSSKKSQRQSIETPTQPHHEVIPSPEIQQHMPSADDFLPNARALSQPSFCTT